MQGWWEGDFRPTVSHIEMTINDSSLKYVNIIFTIRIHCIVFKKNVLGITSASRALRSPDVQWVWNVGLQKVTYKILKVNISQLLRFKCNWHKCSQVIGLASSIMKTCHCDK